MLFDNGNSEAPVCLQQAVLALLNHMSDSMLVLRPTLNLRRVFKGAHLQPFAAGGIEKPRYCCKYVFGKC